MIMNYIYNDHYITIPVRHYSATLRTNLWQYSPIVSGDSDGLDHAVAPPGGGTCGEPTYVQQFNPRQLLVFDGEFPILIGSEVN